MSSVCVNATLVELVISVKNDFPSPIYLNLFGIFADNHDNYRTLGFLLKQPKLPIFWTARRNNTFLRVLRHRNNLALKLLLRAGVNPNFQFEFEGRRGNALDYVIHYLIFEADLDDSVVVILKNLRLAGATFKYDKSFFRGRLHKYDMEEIYNMIFNQPLSLQTIARNKLAHRLCIVNAHNLLEMNFRSLISLRRHYEFALRTECTRVCLKMLTFPDLI